MTDPSTKSYGYGLNTKHNQYDNTESWDAGYGDPAFSVDEFKKLVTDYYNKIEQPDQLKGAKAKVKNAKKALTQAQKADKKKKAAAKRAKARRARARRVKRNHRR